MTNNIFNRGVFVLFFIGAIFSIWGQSCDFTIRGNINDLHDGSPVYGALVRIENSDIFTQTDETGRYLLQGVCSGYLVLVVEHPQCNSLKRKLFIEADDSINFDLEHHINELDEIIISDDQLKQINLSANESRLDVNQITRFSSQSLADALNSFTGVSSLKTGNSIAKPMIHGMFGSRVGIVANGMRLRDQDWGADHAPNIDLNAFENVQLVKGASALKYGGDMVGGVIILSPPKIELKDSLLGKTVINLVQNGMGVSLSSDLIKTYSNGYYVKGQFTWKRFGDIKAPNYILSNTGLKELNYSIKLGRTRIIRGWEINYSRFKNETGILRAAHIGNIQDLLRALNSYEPLRIEPFSYSINAPKQQGTHQNIQFTSFNQFNDQAKWQFDYNYQENTRKEFDVRRGNRSDIASIDLRLRSHSFLSSLKWKKYFTWNFETGISGLIQDNFSNPESGIKRLIPDYLSYELGSFFIGSYKPNNSFSWDWGLRFDRVIWDVQKYYNTSDWEARNYQDVFSDFVVQDFGTQILVNPKLNFINWSAQTGITYVLRNHFRSVFSYILSQRSPNASEMFSDGLHHSLATIEYGNLFLDKEISHKFLMSLNLDKENFKGSIEPYFSTIKDYIFIAPKSLKQTIRGAFPVWEYDATNILLWGIDSSLEIRLMNKMNLELNASYIHAQDRINNQPLISIPSFNTFQKFNYTFKNGLNVELINRYVAFQNRFPDTNFQINSIVEGEITQKLIDISTPPKAYQYLDFSFSFPFDVIEGLNTSIRFIFQNLTNTKYRDYLNRMRFYSNEVGLNAEFQLIISY